MMNIKSVTLLSCILLSTVSLQAQSKHSKETKYPSYKGLMMAGYQGWFRAQGDGTNARRFAYGNEERSGIDMWPDVSEYEKTYDALEAP
jgi:hypothetical protein